MSVLKQDVIYLSHTFSRPHQKQTCFKSETLQFAGFHVESVLGREVGPLAVYVRALGGTPVLRMSLEEVDL